MMDRRRRKFDTRFFMIMATRVRSSSENHYPIPKEQSQERPLFGVNRPALFLPSGYGAARRKVEPEIMTTPMLGQLRFARWAIALLLGITSAAYAAVPPMEVTVFDASGCVAFSGPVSANASFATKNIPPGRYVVQLHTNSAGVKNNQYLIVLGAGKKKLIASAVPGEKFVTGGVAMKVDVGSRLQITGQIANEQATADQGVSKYRVINGKRYAWVTAEIGSNRGGHWVEEGSAPMGNVTVWTADELRKRMDRGGEGSMFTNATHNGLAHGH
jgi:hypothetical protein